MVACCRVGGTECSSECMGPFKGGRHYLHYLHHSLVPGKQHGGNKQNFVGTRTQEKGAVTTQETDPDLPMSAQESLVEVWVRVACCRIQTILNEVAFTFITSTIVWPQVKQQGGDIALHINRKLD